MRVVSWNINSLRKRQEQLLIWLAKTKPDIVCLQETKCADDQFPELILQSAGYHSVFHGQKSYNGVAILSRARPRDVRRSLCDEIEDSQARAIAATIGELRVLSVYAPNGQAIGSEAYEYKLRWFDRLRNCLQASPGQVGNLIVCGDFNVAPSDQDVYDPELWRGAIMCSHSERAAFQRLCGVGLSDTLRLHHPEGGLFSWWDYRMLAFPKNRGLRIDAVLAGASLADRCTDAGIDREMREGREPSDHAPVWAEFS
jgi:exodeoxyribonuclease III